MKRLRIILQSNYFYIITIILIIIYVLITTIVIKYKTSINSSSVEGYIINIKVSSDKVDFIIKGKEKVKCIYYINNSDINYYNYLGSYVKVNGTFKELFNNTIPNNFNYKKYLYNNKIYTSIIVNEIEIIKEPNIFYKIKNKMYSKILSYNDNIKPYLYLFILGDKNELDNDLYSLYQSNGIWHLFAISGMHISLIIFVLSKLFKKIKYSKIVISIVLFYFMFLTNYSPSVERVCIFYYLKSIFEFYDLRISNIKILLLTAIICILINPFIIYNNGFIYSFIITLSIIIFSKSLTGNYLTKIFKISILSLVVSLPITININYEINLLSIILNIFYVPFISLLLFPTIILTFIFNIFSPILNILINLLEISNLIFSSLKISIIVPKMPFVLIIIYYILFYLFYRTNNKRYLVVSLLIIILNIIIPKLDRNTYIYFLDVNQGDSELIITPYKNEVTMIDTGGIINSNYHLVNNTVTLLKSIGITKINTLVISHGDFDHMGEAVNLVNNFKVEKVIFNCGPFNDLEKELIKVLDKKKIKYYSCIKELNIDNNKLYFLQTKEYGNENDNSNVIYAELNGYKFMFMGDAGLDKEKDILDKYNILDIDVLKVGHHGSKTSSSKFFIDGINPKYSVISVGKNNRYGHPNKEVLDNIKNSKIYRTDQDGSIMFKIKNNKLKIVTCSS